ncbi:hypothetical protein FRACYDRAFT_234813 [Fragilariopsis cylindrus CCMP1102]|uniref:Uncharacterized protein n=1 Tax=Fragilariopsis cylindrus CCMP1102 TaxID=635003 RepID=A0A1E7FSR8_9STRA|nr:hypothetical protein FRACYDRAFT_234813 [Fragilariopsis cylindrus CCMP1102]|eukprot:OEU21186.1 hypothetical protein FRACYDRAFT_234813 [Fragilariopsis cylindrus CCMP1102]
MTKDHSGQRSNGDDDRLDNFSTDSSSVATSEEEEHRLKEHEYSSDDDDDDESSDYSRRRKHSKKDRKRRRKEHKKDDYKSKKGGPSSDRDRHNRTTTAQSSSSNNNTRGQQLARALHNLLNDKPNFASELPLILIRLAGGTTFDLRAVTDSSIAQGLQTVFESLEIFGVKKQESSGMWMFQNPPGASRRDELVLLKLIRSILNEEGLTMDEVTKYDKIRQQELSQENAQQQAATHDDECLKPDERRAMKEFTIKILEKFLSKDSTLGSQLANLCKTIVEGESISIDGIPDEELKVALGSLFSACGLENGETNDAVQLKLAIIMSACREGPPKRKAVGPMRRPMTEKEEQDAKVLYSANKANEDKEDEDDDEGPLLPGSVAARKDKSPNVPMEVIKAQAKHRELQLKCTAAGIEMPIEGGGREEWMLIPGEHDFLSGIKSGQAVKSRGFQNKKARGGEKAVAPVHPAVQKEMDAIMQAHQDARGPSLMDEHRSKLSMEKKQKLAAANGKNEWKWSRDDDLDSGRRVDKDHLGMILGGAADNLKTKFKGGFS